MQSTGFILMITCSLFLTAQAAVDAGKKAQLSTGVQTGNNAMPTMTQDLQLQERVQQQLRTTIKNYDPGKFRISTQNNEVIIEGSVRDRAEAEQMEKEALKVQGVTRVQNNLKIETQ